MSRKQRRVAAKLGQTASRPLAATAAAKGRADVAGLLSAGLEHHRAGRLAEAEGYYRRVLAAEPNQADAMHLLGVVAHQFGRHESAVELIRRALQQNGQPNYFFSLGIVFHNHCKLDEAVAAYRQAIRIKPDYAEVHLNLGNALKERGSLDDAVAAYRQAIAIKPNYAEVHLNLGNALKERGSRDDAVAAYRQAISV